MESEVSARRRDRADELVSVILATYNRAHYLSEAIDSVFAQSCQAWELIVVDDGSTDSTPSVLARYGESLRQIRQENRGPAAARNAGIALANGDYLAFLDDDDLWMPEKLAQQWAVLRQRPDVDAVYGHAEQFSSPELDLRHRARFAGMDGTTRAAPLAPAMLIRRPAFERVGVFDESLSIGLEMDWYARFCDLGLSSVMLDSVVYRRRLHRGNLNIERSDEQSERLRVLRVVIARRRGVGTGVPNT